MIDITTYFSQYRQPFKDINALLYPRMGRPG